MNGLIADWIAYYNEHKDEESILNYCPICGDRLDDRKLKTRWFHDMKKHPEYFEAQTGIMIEELLAVIPDTPSDLQ